MDDEGVENTSIQANTHISHTSQITKGHEKKCWVDRFFFHFGSSWIGRLGQINKNWKVSRIWFSTVLLSSPHCLVFALRLVSIFFLVQFFVVVRMKFCTEWRRIAYAVYTHTVYYIKFIATSVRCNVVISDISSAVFEFCFISKLSP